MEQYIVTGMSCAACSARVERAVSQVEGVTFCAVNLLTASMGVEGIAEPEDIIKAVEKAGYGATIKPKNNRSFSENGEAFSKEDDLTDKEASKLKKRLIASLGFLLILMYISMGHVMWGWPLPVVLSQNPVTLAMIQCILTIIVISINRKFFVNGFQGMLHRAPNMDTLVAMGSGAAFIYSTVILGIMCKAGGAGDYHVTEHYLHELYFESAAMILVLITVGKMLEARAKGKTTDALKGLMKLKPATATLVVNGKEQEVPIEQVNRGDVFILRPGEQIPVDGVVLEGISAVNESVLTGESIPVDKAVGDNVSSGTLNQSGYLKCEATRVGEDTTLAQIIQMVSDGVASKAPIAQVADKVSGIFVPVVLVIAMITLAGWLIAGKSIGFALARSISVLVISCPCALGLATPVAIMVGSGVGARQGILFKTAASLEEAGKADIIVLDKTGTLTEGAPRVTEILPIEGVSKGELLGLAYILEKKSEHPLAKAIIEEACTFWEEGTEVTANDFAVQQIAHVTEKPGNKTVEKVSLEVTDFKSLPGNGLTGTLAGKVLCGGSLAFMQTQVLVPDTIIKKADELAKEGKTPLYFAYDRELLGIITVADALKSDSATAVKEFHSMGLQVVMLTGDNERTAHAIAKQAGLDKVIAGVLPEGKKRIIGELQEQGKVIMVGDGINDAPALVTADIGMAIGAGTDVAMDAADVVLMKNSLWDVAVAIGLSRSTLRNIHQNLFWAFFYNSIGIPLAAGVFIPILGWQLNPMFGAAAMSLSSFCVVSNALRLNRYHFSKLRRDVNTKDANLSEKNQCTSSVRKEDICEYRGSLEETVMRRVALNNKVEGEETILEKTLRIEGMMCGHCEARVKKVLEALEQVETAKVSHQQGTATVTLKTAISDEDLRKVIEDQDYTVLEIL